MTNVAGFRTISPAEPAVACASVDNDDDDGFSGSVSSAPQGGRSDDAGGDKKLDSPKSGSPSVSGAVQQLCSGSVDKRDGSGSPSLRGDNTPVSRMGWCSDSADHRHNNRSEEISDGWVAERSNGTVGTGHRPEPHASTEVRRPCRPTSGKAHVHGNEHVNGQGHGYRPVYTISEEEASAASGALVDSSLSTRRDGVDVYEGRRLLTGRPEHVATAVPTTAVVPYPHDSCVALEHPYSAPAEREASRGEAGSVEDGSVCGWECRRPAGARKYISPASPSTASVSVFAIGQTKRYRCPIGSPVLKSLHEAHVEGGKVSSGGHQKQVSAQMARAGVAEVVTTSPSSSTMMLSLNTMTVSCSHRSPTQRGHEAQAESEGRRTACSAERGQPRREFMKNAATDSEGSRTHPGPHDASRASAEPVAGGPVAEGDEGDDGSGRGMRVFKVTEKQEVVAAAATAAACGSGEDTDDEPLSVAARKKTERSRPWGGEQDPGEARSTASTAEVQSDRWTVLEGSIPKLEGGAPGTIRGASPASDAASRRGECSTPQRLSAYVLKSSAQFPVQRTDGGSYPSSPSDNGRQRRLTIPAVDGFDGAAIASGEACRDSRGFCGEGHGGHIRAAAAEPDRSTTKVEDTTIARQSKEERELSDDAERRPSTSPREEPPATTVTASRRGNAEAADSARVPEQGTTEKDIVCADQVVNKSPHCWRGDAQGSPRESEEDALRSGGRRDSRISSGACGGRSSISSSCSGSIGAPDVDDYMISAMGFISRSRQPGDDLSSVSGVEKAAAALAAVPTAAKAAKVAAMSVCRPIIPGVPPGAIVDDAETSAGEDCPVEVSVRDSGELVYSFKKSGRHRRGKWSRLEEEFAKRIISDFDDGVLGAQPGIGLRQLLASKLRCEVMRVSKKFSGWACVGKRSFRPVRSPDGKVKRAQASLHALEQRWLKTFVPSSTLPAKPPASEPSIVARPPAPPAPKSLMRLVPAPPAVERDGGVGSLKKNANPTQVWLDRAMKALSHDASVNAMNSLVREGQRYVSERGGEAGKGSGGPSQGHAHLLGERFPPHAFSDTEEARRYHSVPGVSHAVRGHFAENTPAYGGSNDEAAAELQRRRVTGSNKLMVVGKPQPGDHRQQHQKEMELDGANGSGLPRFESEQQLLARPNDGPGGRGEMVGGATRTEVFAAPQPSPSARHHPWPDRDAHRQDDGRETEKGNPHIVGWGAVRQPPESYAPYQHSRVQEQRREEVPAAYGHVQDGNNHGHDHRVGSPRDVCSPWQQRRVALRQNARSLGASDDTGATGAGTTGASATGAVEDAAPGPLFANFSGRRNNDSVDAPSKTATPTTTYVGGGVRVGGGWAKAPASSPVADKQGSGRIQAVRPQQPRSPCTISRPNGDARSTLAAAAEASRSDNYPHFRKQLVSPADGRVEGEKRAIVLDQRERGSGPAYPSSAWRHDPPSLPRPGSDGQKSVENCGGGDGSPRTADPCVRRPGPFRLKLPTTLPPHLRVEQNVMSFFPGDGREADTAAENGFYSKPTPPLHQQHQQHEQLEKSSVQRLPVDGHHLGGSLRSEVEPVPVERVRDYCEGEDAVGQHQRPFKSRRIEVDGVSSNGFGIDGGDRRYNNRYRYGYSERPPPSDSSDSAVKPVVNGGWRPYAAERNLATEDAYAASSLKAAGGSGTPSVQDSSADAPSSRVVDAHPHYRRNNFASPPAGVRADGWGSSSGPQESHLRPKDRGFVVPPGGHLVLRVEASPDSRRSSACDGSPGVVREPFAACRE